MELLIFSQIIFNFTVSIAVLMACILLGLLCYKIKVAIESAERFFNGLNEKSNSLYGRVESILTWTSFIPGILKFFKKEKKEEENY